jgi:hypothetical protein
MQSTLTTSVNGLKSLFLRKEAELAFWAILCVLAILSLAGCGSLSTNEDWLYKTL